ncbi:MAG: serine/threonine protein kinase [Kofleriaceae bacterium]|nr:serine/threonine protein kinase [Kofleriaceae bacterium]
MTSYVCALCGQRYPEPGYCGADGGTLVVPADPLLGEQVGRWRLARVVGAGGMGRVYLGVQPDIGSRVAVKVLSEECARDPALIERFFAEARAVNLIRHEHIVNVLDLARLADGRPYIVMEFVEGGTLGELSRRGELSAGMVVHVTLQVLEALAAAHRQGVVHRDLKPDNVLVTRGGQAKVLDFGIAKLAPSVVGTNSPRTQTGALLGTPEYMAPEQVSGGVIDGRTDLYACGVMLYELVTGQRPFVSGNLFALMRAHVEDQPVPPRALRADVPVGLEEVILRALAKDPAARFVDADDMANALVAAGAELAPGWPSARTSGQRAPVSGSGLGGGNTGRGPGTPGTGPTAPAPPPPWSQPTLQAAPPSAAVPATERGAARSNAPWLIAGAILAAGAAVAIALVVASGGRDAPAPGAAPEEVAAGSAVPAPGGPAPTTPTPTTPTTPTTQAPTTPTPTTPTTPRPAPTAADPSGPGAPPVAQVVRPDARLPVAAPSADAAPSVSARPGNEPVLEHRDTVIIGPGVSIGPGVTINAGGGKRPTLVSKPDVDTRRFDAVTYLPRARDLARRLLADAELTAFEVQAVGKGGLANLTLTRDLQASYWFRSKAASPRPAGVPKGVDVDIACMVYVDVSAKEITAYVTTREECDDRFLRRPRCSLATVWDRALAKGAPADHVAEIDLLGDGWYVQFGDDWSETIPDDC